MEELTNQILNSNYKKIPFRISKTKHLIIKAKINGIEGRFILDTGASNSCVALEYENHFNIASSDSETTAAGAGAVGMKTKISFANMLQISRWKNKNFSIVILDLSHVNKALQNYKVKPVNGIIGADLLITNQAIIDYANKILYLK